MSKTRKINIGTMLLIKLQTFMWIPLVFPVMSFTFSRFSSGSDTAFSICLPAAAAAKSLQSCPTLCDPIDGSLPGSAVPGILQARTLEWVAISFSNAWKLKVKVKSISRVRLLATPWTAAYQAPPSMGFSRQRENRSWNSWIPGGLVNPLGSNEILWLTRNKLHCKQLK